MPEMKNIKIWQINYFEHIIRDEEDYARIADYNRINPSNWEKDELF
jgi:putative transposase